MQGDILQAITDATRNIYEKQEDASPATALVQHSMSPSVAASAPGDADSAATLSAAQHATQCSSSYIRGSFEYSWKLKTENWKLL